ncbi:hypothetical protein Leryth_011993 [Lithospermum erythrorhizon]|nr:hypothetical protein Leryth_011993 [Lithospermum erythrorhizon]
MMSDESWSEHESSRNQLHRNYVRKRRLFRYAAFAHHKKPYAITFFADRLCCTWYVVPLCDDHLIVLLGHHNGNNCYESLGYA